MNGFTVEADNSKVMYVAMRDGFFKSTDAGRTWKALGDQLKNLAAVVVNPKRPNDVYVSTADGAIFKSEDGGMTWERQQ